MRAAEAMPVSLIGAAFGRGARDPGCADSPAGLRAAGLAERLVAAGIPAHWRAIVADPDPMLAPMAAAARVSAAVADMCAAAVAAGERPVVVGGDHSCAAGTWSGVARTVRKRGRLGLIWIDAHLDSHTPAHSYTGAIQ